MRRFYKKVICLATGKPRSIQRKNVTKEGIFYDDLIEEGKAPISCDDCETPTLKIGEISEKYNAEDITPERYFDFSKLIGNGRCEYSSIKLPDNTICNVCFGSSYGKIGEYEQSGVCEMEMTAIGPSEDKLIEEMKNVFSGPGNNNVKEHHVKVLKEELE